MNANEKEQILSGILRNCARGCTSVQVKAEDLDASTLAVLWAAFQAEARAMGLSEWRGVDLGDV